MLFKDFTAGLTSVKPSEENLANLEKILSISRKFHSDAGIAFPEVSPSESSVVLESGHQPNFFPHAGTFRKAFALSEAGKSIKDSIALFGFADYNLSTAKILYKNKLPAATKTGSESVGFSIAKEDSWKSFHLIPKPSEEEFKKVLEKIKKQYSPNFLSVLESSFLESYPRANGMADLNAFIFARVCSSMGINALFFRYTDVQKEGLFLPQYQKMLSSLEEYNRTYNRTISENGISDLRPAEDSAAPLWFDCQCGCKAQMYLKDGALSAKCVSCQKEVSFPSSELEKNASSVSPNAVARNIAFADGLPTSVFFSGAGGGLRYGKVSDAISKNLAFHLPITLAWAGRDYYMGPVQSKALADLKRLLSIDDISGREALSNRIKAVSGQLSSMAASALGKKDAQRFSGQAVQLKAQVLMASQIFSLTPSFADELASLGSDAILSGWKERMNSSEIVLSGGAYVLNGGAVFVDGAPKIYETIGGLENV